MGLFYCITIPAGIGLLSIYRGLSRRLPLAQNRQGPGDQRHEADRHQRVALQPALALHDTLDDLGGGIAADRHDQDAAHGKLVDQRLGAFVGGGGHDDAVERRLAGHDWLTDTGPTVADLALCGYTQAADEGGFDLAHWPGTRAWVARVLALLAPAPLRAKNGYLVLVCSLTLVGILLLRYFVLYAGQMTVV